ncbi:hypothetical protein DPMN_110624 [Dreissena polymorpha]|uniref:Uncharacterized protein n=1 Tax=Dreissena polymorpha TaxID=45954 RepID=A0A9D4KCY3_DREPO|nr:hypothetical protein DPMN_110624 [Dreissena polymorpha]
MAYTLYSIVLYTVLVSTSDTTSTHSEGGNNDRFRQNDRKNDISFSGGMFTQIGDNNKLVLTIGGSSDGNA